MELVATQDGFVGEMARGFTFQALGEVAAGFGKRLQAEGIPRVVVGHDARFLAREMAEHAAGVLGGLGLEVHLLQGPAPLPLFGFALRAKEAAGLYLTGSRRPFAFQGVKLRLGPGRPLPGKEVAPAPPPPPGPFAPLEARRDYLDHLRKSAQGLALKRCVVYLDAMGGAGGGILGQVLKRLEAPVELRELHPLPHPLFYGVAPDPRPEHLRTLRLLLREAKPHALGLALDGDADRLGVYLPGGEALPGDQALARLREAAQGREVEALGEGVYRFPWHLEEPDPFLAALLLMGVLL